MLVGVSNIDVSNKCISTLSNWQEEILNAFDTGLTSGYTEGCNNKIKVIKRNLYATREFTRFRKRILISMNQRQFSLLIVELKN
ncbi:MAG: transposase [Aminipila sp.]